FEDGSWRGRVAAIAEGLRAGLEPCRGLPGVVDVRVLGAIGVVEMQAPVPAGELSRRFAELGVWVRPMGRVVYLTPPFVVSAEELDRLTGAIRTLLSS
ncbi:aminotransferase class III-fold pyridoxal phosphate-dependent enzyme, partial [Phenylobacterium soli]